MKPKSVLVNYKISCASQGYGDGARAAGIFYSEIAGIFYSELESEGERGSVCMYFRGWIRPETV